MEEQLLYKEQQLVELTKKQTDLERKFLFLNLNETETKSDNERLLKVSFEREFIVSSEKKEFLRRKIN